MSQGSRPSREGTLLPVGELRTVRAAELGRQTARNFDPSYTVTHAPLLYLWTGGEGILVHPERVVVIKAVEKEVLLTLEDGRVVTSNSLSIVRLIEAFPGVWMRLDRSYAVRSNSISHVQGRWCYMTNGDRVPVSRRQWYALLERAHTGKARRGAKEQWAKVVSRETKSDEKVT